jgi:hypothetical protein
MSNTRPKDLSAWLKIKVTDNNTLFDECADLYDIITTELNENNLFLKAENKVLMIKLCKFFYENSHH